ncbi:MAG: GNAT family N-acetyltransferase [Bacteroidota bacterium]
MKHDIILETPRLLLRKKVVEDAPFFFDLNSDPLVTRYTGDAAFKDVQGAEDIVKYVMCQYEKNGYGRWMVIEKETNNPIGWCGLKYLEETEETDLGYRFMQKYWGKGFATEASQACLDYGFRVLNLERIIGRAVKENVDSIKVLKKVGMTFCKEELCHEHAAFIYELKKENF